MAIFKPLHEDHTRTSFIDNVRLGVYTMTMEITPSHLRENLYAILDQVAETGVSPEIVLRKGRRLRIVADRKPDIFTRLKKHPKILKGAPDDIVHMDWSRYWNHDLP